MSANQDTVEQTKQQIRGLVNEIAALSKSGAPAEEFYPALLQRIIAALAASGGAIWLFDEDRDLQLKHQINCSESLLEKEGEDTSRHNRLIRRVAASGQSLLVPPYSGTTDAEGEGNPTRFLLVLSPLRSESQTEGLIEIFQRAESQPRTQQGYLKFLQQMTEVASEWLKGHELRTLGTRQVLWQQADTFARATHESLDLRQTCYTLANEGRRMIGCDRVSVAIMRGNKCKVEAISGQDTIENRSNIISSLNRLATKVCAAGEPLWHDGNTEDLPPQIEEALEDYVDQSFGRSIAVLPLREPKRNQPPGSQHATGEVDRDDAHRGRVIGALIVEQIESNLPAVVLRSRTDLVYEHGTRAVANSLSHSTLFLMPVWRTLGKASWLIRGSMLWKTVAVTSLIAAVGLFLAFFPIDFDLEGEGSLQPDVKHNVFAKVEGEVIEIKVVHAQKVAAGEMLVLLKNKDLEEKRINTNNEYQQAQAEYARVTGMLVAGSIRDALEKERLVGERRELETKGEGLQRKLSVLEEQIQNLTVVSPIAGRVVTWDVEQTLRGRPVTTGQVLLEVADPTQDWHLEVMLPEKRMRHLDQALRDANGKLLDVDFILATDPDTKLKGTLMEIEQRAGADTESGSVVKLRVKPENMEGKGIELRPGARVTADVKCGKAPAGYVWFYQVYEWIVTFVF